MKNLRILLIVLLAAPMTYAAGLEMKEEKSKKAISAEEQIKANFLLVSGVGEQDLAKVEAALKQGADIMTSIANPAIYPAAPSTISVLNYVIRSGLQDPFRHAVFNLFFAYNKLDAHNLNMFMNTEFLDDPQVSSPDWSMTPFQICVISETVDLVKKGIEHGGDVNKTTRRGMTPLMLLARGTNHELEPMSTASAEVAAQRERNQIDIAELLIKAGASIDSEYIEHIWVPLAISSHTALDYAIAFDCIGVAKVLLAHKARFNPVDGLFNAVSNAFIAMVDLLLNYGINPNETSADRDGRTPLMNVCSHIEGGNIDIAMIQRLLQAGADPLIEDEYGRDAAWYLMHSRDYDEEDLYVPDATLTPERLQATKLLNDAIAQRLKENPHALFGAPGIPELAGEYLSGETPKKSAPVEEPDEEEGEE